ncbi:MAG: hypothetical protein FWC89_06330 [Defluviitaleaceae bacterium]|nr:hypothetical protein [Defluviitaleaceae bacterium]
MKYERQLNEQRNKKRELYERYVGREINTEEYLQLKTDADTAYGQLEQSYAAWKKHTDQVTTQQVLGNKVLEVAEKISSEPTLTVTLADLLIDKVFVYPDNQVEVEWKASEIFPLTFFSFSLTY